MVIKYSLQNILAKNAMELTLKIALNVQLKIIENQQIMVIAIVKMAIMMWKTIKNANNAIILGHFFLNS